MNWVVSHFTQQQVMASLSSFLSSLPSMSLAAADLPRFLTRALNRRTVTELEQLRAIIDDQPLSGYPSALGPVMCRLIDTMIAQDIDPEKLEPDLVDSILRSRAWLATVAEVVAIERQPLRPGVPLSDHVKEVTARNLETYPGIGSQLALVCPVEVIRLPGLGWSCVQGPVLGRLMAPTEAERLRDVWACIEECFGWRTPEVFPWEARFVQIAARHNHQTSEIGAQLSACESQTRITLWRVIIDHIRDTELPDTHRPGMNELINRLDAMEISFSSTLLETLLPLARAAYEGCAIDARVRRGLCPCTKRDLASYLKRADTATGTKTRLSAYTPDQIEHFMRILSAMEYYGVDLDVSMDFQRDLRGLRDGMLALRYRRDVSALWGVDPLLYVAARYEEGADSEQIFTDLEALVTEARRQTKGGGDPQAALDLRVDAGPGMVKLPPNPFGSQNTEQVEQDVVAEQHSAAELQPPQPNLPGTIMELPPLPKAPARKRPRTDTDIKLPPMPDMPQKGEANAKSRRKMPSEEFAEIPLPTIPPKREFKPRPKTMPPIPQPRNEVTRQIGALPELVTPTQAVAFYEKAFKTLQSLERDVLEQGVSDSALGLLDELKAQAGEINCALGPAARSGDKVFDDALHKVAKVEDYVARLMERIASYSVREPTIEKPPKKKGFGFFRKKDR